MKEIYKISFVVFTNQWRWGSAPTLPEAMRNAMVDLKCKWWGWVVLHESEETNITILDTGGISVEHGQVFKITNEGDPISLSEVLHQPAYEILSTAEEFARELDGGYEVARAIDSFLIEDPNFEQEFLDYLTH